MTSQSKKICPPEQIKPWYKQFWPWFIIMFPASAVIAGLATVYIAFKNADSLVNDDYFKEGLAINQSLEQDQMAKALGLTALVEWDKTTGEILVTVHPNQAPVNTTLGSQTLADKTSSDEAVPPDSSTNLKLLLLHPTDKAGDLSLDLDLIAPGYYRASVEKPLRYRYYLRLQPSQGVSWRLNGELDFEHSAMVSLGSQ